MKWVRDVPTPTKTWHELKVVIKGNTVEGYPNGKLYLTDQLAQPVSGKVGVWSKADSHMYIDDFRVVSAPCGVASAWRPIMKTAELTRCVTAALMGAALAGSPLQASEQSPGDARARLSELSGQMSTCAAYYYLLASVVEDSAGREAKADLAEHIRSTGQAMFVQAVNVANHIGMNGEAAAERSKVALAEMLETINSDPPNSLQVMRNRYGQPCNELLQSAPQRLADLLKQYHPSH